MADMRNLMKRVIGGAALGVLSAGMAQAMPTSMAGAATPAPVSVVPHTTCVIANDCHATQLEYSYSTDIVNRVNAERAARGLPALINSAYLDNNAQYQASGDPWFGPPAPTQAPNCGASTVVPANTATYCVLGYAGISTFNTSYPGDGSDGVAQQLMGNPTYRDALLGAGMMTISVGANCVSAGPPSLPQPEYGAEVVVQIGEYFVGPGVSTNPSWGFSDWSDYSAATSAQYAADGNPLPASPVVAGLGTGDPWYCPGQEIPGGGTTSAGGQ